MKNKIKIKTPEGIIERVPKVERFGNFVHVIIRYKNEHYQLGDGDEYLRGAPEVWDLENAKKVER
jgi:hypothetical protein